MTAPSDPRREDPTADAPRDLAGDDPGWDAPVVDLTAPGAGTDTAEAPVGRGPRDVIGPDAGGVRSDDAPPAGPPDGVLTDLTGQDAEPGSGVLTDLGAPDGGTRVRIVDGASGAGSDACGDAAQDDLWAPADLPVVAASDGVPDRASVDDDWAPVPPAARAGRRGRAARRGGAGRDAAERAEARPRAHGDAQPRLREADARDGAREDSGVPGAPRGLATGGPLGGLEPGTLFTDDLPGETVGRERGGERRRGRRAGRAGDRGTGGRGPGPAADLSSPVGDVPLAADGGTGSDGGTGRRPDASRGSDRPPTAEERLQQALKLAYRHLTKRDRTVAEVRTHLERREIDEPSIAGALAELREFGYLDDERYAVRFVEDKRRIEGWGRLRIEQGLRRTGIDRDVVDRALADDPLRDDEAELAVDALEQRLGGRVPEDDRARQKALRLLATRGFPLEVAYAAVRAYERRCVDRGDG